MFLLPSSLLASGSRLSSYKNVGVATKADTPSRGDERLTERMHFGFDLRRVRHYLRHFFPYQLTMAAPESMNDSPNC